jgi:predicted lipid carrier protein YhbT
VIRHQVQEAAVHRWDAEHARGRASALPPDAAADAVAEFLQHSLGPGVDTADRLTGAVELRATDTAARWRLSPQPNGPPVIRSTPNDDGSAAATVSAPAFDLLLLLYRRLTADSVHVDGDHTQVAALAGHTATD